MGTETSLFLEEALRHICSKQESICPARQDFVGQNQAGCAGALVNTQQPPVANWSLPRELWLQKPLQLRVLTNGVVDNSITDAELCGELQPMAHRQYS